MDKTRYSCENIYFEFLTVRGGTQKENENKIPKKRVSELFKKKYIRKLEKMKIGMNYG